MKNSFQITTPKTYGCSFLKFVMSVTNHDVIDIFSVRPKVLSLRNSDEFNYVEIRMVCSAA